MRTPRANQTEATSAAYSLHAERGATAAEYAILVSLVAAVVAATVASLGGIVLTLWQVSW